MLKDASCPVGLSLYALPKTGSSFLGRFLKALAVYLQTCMVLEVKTECSVTLRVGCPPEWGGRRTATMDACGSRSDGCSWGWLLSHTRQLEKRCCGQNIPGNDSEYAECVNTITTDTTHQVRLPRTIGTLGETLSAAGFVRGPIRQLPFRVDSFLASLQNRRLIVLHARHPIEAMVSLFYCISESAVCPVRQNASNLPESASKGLDAFLLQDLAGGPGSHLNRQLTKYEALASLWQGAQASPTELTLRPRILFSRYELLVERFSLWLKQLLVALPLPLDARRELHKKLLEQYQGEFVPDGKHKHSLRVGSNLARVKRSTLHELSRNARLAAVMTTLNYSFSPTKSLAILGSSSRGGIQHTRPQMQCHTIMRQPSVLVHDSEVLNEN